MKSLSFVWYLAFFRSDIFFEALAFVAPKTIGGGNIMLYFLTGLIFIAVLLFLMPVVLSIDIKRVKENENITIGVYGLYGLLKFKTEIPFLKIVFENGKPALRYKVEVANKKRSKLFARFTKLFSVEEGEGFYEIYKDNKNKIIPALKYITGKTEIKNFNLRFTLGTGDAAETGVLYGIAWIVIGNIMTLTRSYLNIIKPRIVVVPIFNQVQLSVDFSCIISMRLGHIINTGIRVIPVLLSSNEK